MGGGGGDNIYTGRIDLYTCTCTKGRYAIFPDFSGIPDFHKSKLSMKNL